MMDKQITEIVNKNADSVEITRGMTGNFGFSVKKYCNLNEGGQKAVDSVKSFIDGLNGVYPVKEKKK